MELQKIREKKAAKEAEAHQHGLESDGHRTDGGYQHGRRQVSFAYTCKVTELHEVCTISSLISLKGWNVLTYVI